MTDDTGSLSKEVENLFSIGKYKEIITLLTDEVIEKELKENRDKAAELYLMRGNAQYEKNNYDKAIDNYSKAIEINPDYYLAYYNRGSTRGAKKEEYIEAIADYDKVIEICQDKETLVCPDKAYYYFARGTAFRAINEDSKALNDYEKAIEIDPNLASAYYNIGLVRKDANALQEAMQYFKKYLELNTNENDTWSKYANYYIEDIAERLADKDISDIADLIDLIKKELLFNDELVTHYTGLSTLTSLLGKNNKFRVSEGHFLNDPSEGTVFFGYLKCNTSGLHKNSFCSEDFAPKPFIGSFVPKEKHNDLNMWRFYGKENGAEANGCAITIWANKFIEDINFSLAQENDYTKYESDINFYSVVYLDVEANDITQGANDIAKLKDLMTQLKERVNNYTDANKDRAILEKRLNTIAFLFKSDVYKHENEVRMIVNGVEFKREYMMERVPPRVYIELASIKNIVKQITLGPNVDSISQCAAAFYYYYEENPPTITFSHIPYR